MSDDVINFELKQSQSVNVNANGDYSVVMQKPITIENGDSLSIDKIFVDTSAQTESTINVLDDMTLTFTFTHWLTGLFTDSRTYSGQALPITSCRKFIPCVETRVADVPTGFVEIRELSFFADYENRKIPSFFYGGFPVKFSYIDINNKVQIFSTSVPKRYYDAKKGIPTLENGITVIPVGVVGKRNSEIQIEPVAQPAPQFNTQIIWGENINDPTISTIVVSLSDGFDIFAPVTRTRSILIPRGSYNPAVMADLITTKMIANFYQKSETDGILDNTLLFTSNDYIIDPATGKEISFNSSERDTLGRLDPFFFKFTTASPAVFIGTNQFAIEYDGISHFVIKQMHMPVYIDGNKVVLYTTTIQTPDVPLPVLSYSGIILTDVTSTYATLDEPVNFFRDSLGFDMGVLNPQSQMGEVDYGDGGLQPKPSLTPVFQFNGGVNITEGLNSIDNVVSKGKSSAQADNNTFTIAEIPNNTAVIIGDASQSIISNNIFDNNRLGGYYKVKIDCGVSTFTESEDNIERNVFGILSKYYESNSFASGGAESAVPYIHKGAPVELSLFKVRILDSNNQTPIEISEDNTVMLRLTKAQRAPIVPPVTSALVPNPKK